MAKENHDSWYFFQQDIVQKHFQMARQAVADRAAAEFEWGTYARLDVHPTGVTSPEQIRHLESVTEAVFELWFQATKISIDPFYLIRQHEVETRGNKYRFDFALCLSGMQPLEFLPIAIELDGHAFHERTKEQVAYRNQRDRDLQAAGYRVLHFSYSELMANPQTCVHDVIAAGWTAIRQRNAQSAE